MQDFVTIVWIRGSCQAGIWKPYRGGAEHAEGGEFGWKNLSDLCASAVNTFSELWLGSARVVAESDLPGGTIGSKVQLLLRLRNTGSNTFHTFFATISCPFAVG